MVMMMMMMMAIMMKMMSSFHYIFATRKVTMILRTRSFSNSRIRPLGGFIDS